jgi:Ca2+-binding RTX toxin-like protein
MERVTPLGKVVGVLTALALLQMPGAASASVARLDFVDDARVEYVADAGETNVVTISLSGGTYTVVDSVDVVAGDGCTQVGPRQADCPEADVRRVTARGEDLDDTITVTAAPVNGAVINGGTGDDRLYGGDAGDRLLGAEGDDVLDGGLDNDVLDGGTGADTASYETRTAPVGVDMSFKLGGLSGGDIATNEQDGILANVENATGGMGDDEIVGGEGYNTLSGGPGGKDVICGGLGVDTVDYTDRVTPVRVSLDGSMATDPNIGTPSSAREDCRELSSTSLPRPPGQGARDCVANDGADADGDGVAEEQDCVGEDVENVLGGHAGDTLVGNDPDLRITESPRVEPRGRNRLVGGAGDDVLDGRFGPDVFEGQTGTDTVTYANRVVGVNATIDGVADDGDAVGPIGGDLEPDDGRRDNIETDVENVDGGGGADVIEGDADANRLEGGPGDDTVFGGDGTGADDALSGGPGNDRVHGGEGDDGLLGGDGDDFLDGGPGADQLRGESGNDQLAGRGGADSIGGGDGSDVADYSEATTPVSVTPEGFPDDGAGGEGDNVDIDVEGAIGGSDSDLLIGNGGGGIFFGGNGDDRIGPGAGPDVVFGGPGFDAVSYAGRTAAVRVDLAASGGDGEAGENDDLQPDVEQVVGGAGDDQLTGSAGANTLIGGGGRDRLAGRDGVDLLQGGANADVLEGGPGQDILAGGDGNDSLDGGISSDTLDGGAGEDQAVYSARREPVTVTLDGKPDDGARGENDRIKTNVEGVAGGAGRDRLDTSDGVAGDVSCGPGRDDLVADTVDRVDVDCEEVNGRAFGLCTASGGGLRVTPGGSVTVRVSCSFSARGSVRLATTNAVKSGKRILLLGSDSFSASGSRATPVKVDISREGRRLVVREKRLRARVTVISRPRGKRGQTASRKRSSRVVTLRMRGRG